MTERAGAARSDTIIRALPAVLLAFGAISRRWIADDALIYVRVAEVALDGGGPSFNELIRVGTATGPLWLLALVVGGALTPLPVDLFAVVFAGVCAVGGMSHSYASARVMQRLGDVVEGNDPGSLVIDRGDVGPPIVVRLRDELSDEVVLVTSVLGIPATQFGDPDAPLPDGLDPERVAAARRALGCGELAQLVEATTEPMDLDRFLSNVRRAAPLTTFRFHPDPLVAEEELCT